MDLFNGLAIDGEGVVEGHVVGGCAVSVLLLFGVNGALFAVLVLWEKDVSHL